MKVEYSKRALADLRKISSYYLETDNARIATAIGSRIREVVAYVAQLPESGRRVAQRPGVRVVPLLRYRYRIFYRVIGDTIRIVHIRHSSRRPWPTS